jgi:hypothetical protein
LNARCKKLAELLEASEGAKATLESYARKLEAKLHTTDVGQALLKAARLGQDLDAAKQQLTRLKSEKEGLVSSRTRPTKAAVARSKQKLLQ